MSKYKDYDDDRDYEHEHEDDDRKEKDDDGAVIPVVIPITNIDVAITETTNNTTVINNPTITNNVVNNNNNTVMNNTTVVDTVIINQNKIKNYIYGTSRKDYLTGTNADDVIYGYNGNDTLIGGLGADELIGGKGKNKYSSAPDGAVDLIYVKKDNQVDKITTIGTEDRVVIGSSNITVSETSKGIGIFYNHKLQALYTGNDLSLSQFQALVV